MANKFLPQNVQINETKFYNRHAISMLPTMPVPVETIQSAEITSPTSAQNSSNNSNVVVGSNPCAVPIATLSIRDLRLRGSSFIRSHASKHGLPNASRKLMKEVIELLKSHYAVVHQVAMLEDDFGDAGAGTQRFQMTKTRQSSPNMISRIFENQLQQICIISVSAVTSLSCIFAYHSMARVNLNKSVWLVTKTTTASK